VWVRCLGPSVCPQHNSKMNDPKVFKRGIGNDLGISYKWYGFGVERSKVNIKFRVRVDSNAAWVGRL